MRPNYFFYFFGLFAQALLSFVSAAESKDVNNSQPAYYYLFVIDFVTDPDRPALVGFYRLPLGKDAINDQSLVSQQFSIPDVVLNNIAGIPSIKPTTCALAALENESKSQNSTDVVFCLSRNIKPLLELLGIKQASHSLSNNDSFQNITLPSGFTPKIDLGRLLSPGGEEGGDDDRFFPGFTPDLGKSIFDMPELVFDAYLILAWFSEQLKLTSNFRAWSSNSGLNKPQTFCNSLPPTTKKCSQWLGEFEPDFLSMANSMTPTKQDYLNLLYQQSEVVTLYPVYSLPEGASAGLMHREDIAHIGQPCAACGSSFSGPDEVILSPCNHLFHRRCLDGLNRCTTCSGDLSQLMPYLNTEAMQEDTLTDRLTAYLKGQTNTLGAANKIAISVKKLLKAKQHIIKLKSKPSDDDIKDFTSFIIKNLDEAQIENIERVIQGTPMQSSTRRDTQTNHLPLKVLLDTAPFRETGGVADTIISTSLHNSAQIRGVRAQRQELGIDTDISDSFDTLDITGRIKTNLRKKEKRGPDTPAFRLHNIVLNTACLNPFSNQFIGTYITFRLADENVNKSLSVARSGLDKITRQATYAENYTTNIFRHLMVEFQNHQQLMDFLTSSSQKFVGTITALHGIEPEDYEHFKREVIDLFEAHRQHLADAYVNAPVIEDGQSEFFADYSDAKDAPDASKADQK